MKYNVIYADPPWSFGSKLVSGRATAKGLKEGRARQKTIEESYNVMSDKELDFFFRTKVRRLAADDCVLIMWTTDAHLSVAIEIAKAAGFQYKTVAFVWNKKTNTGKQVCYMGTWTMKGTEIALLFTKGTPHKLLKSRKVRQLVEAERREHSRKPDEVRNRISQMFPDGLKIELFARERHNGWDSMGNELTKF